MAIACCDVDAYVIVYSVTDRDSFKTSQQILQALSTQENYHKKAAILVGNKIDLVRKRVVNTEGNYHMKSILFNDHTLIDRASY